MSIAGHIDRMLSERRDVRNVAERIARVIVEAALSGDIAAARLVVEVEEHFHPALDCGRGRMRWTETWNPRGSRPRGLQGR
jgi:hypothetical protein